MARQRPKRPPDPQPPARALHTPSSGILRTAAVFTDCFARKAKGVIWGNYARYAHRSVQTLWFPDNVHQTKAFLAALNHNAVDKTDSEGVKLVLNVSRL